MLQPIREGETVKIQVERGDRHHKILIANEYFPEFAKIIAEAISAKGAKVEFEINEDFI